MFGHRTWGFSKCFGLDKVSSSEKLEYVELVTSEFDTWVRVFLACLLLDAFLDVLLSPLPLEEDRHLWLDLVELLGKCRVCSLLHSSCPWFDWSNSSNSSGDVGSSPLLHPPHRSWCGVVAPVLPLEIHRESRTPAFVSRRFLWWNCYWYGRSLALSGNRKFF